MNKKILITFCAYIFSTSLLAVDVAKECAEVGDSSVRAYVGTANYDNAVNVWDAETIAQQLGGEAGVSTWILTMASNAKIRKAALLNQQNRSMTTAYNKSRQFTDKAAAIDWNSYFNENKKTIKYSSSTLSNINNFFDVLDKQDGYGYKNVTEMKLAAPFFCSELNVKNKDGCYSGLVDVARFAIPKLSGNYVVSMIPLWRDVLINGGDYQAGLALASQKIEDYIEDIKSGRSDTLTKRHYISDLIESFVNAGFSEMKSKEMAHNIMGLYGSRGASVDFLMNLVNKETAPFIIMLMYNYAAITYLDLYKAQGDGIYSLPAQINSTCRFGKTYHFWMSEFLTAKTYNAKSMNSSLFGAHILGNIYESLNNSTRGRSDILAPFRADLYSPICNSRRFGIAFRDLGALWAKAQIHGKKDDTFTLDTSFQLLHSKTVPLSDDEKQKVLNSPDSKTTVYKYWSKMFNSDILVDI